MKYITVIILVIILFVGICAYKDINEKFQAVDDYMDTMFQEVDNEINAQFHLGTDICSIVGKDATMSVYYQLPNIDIKDYPITLDVGVLTLEEQTVFLDVLDAVAKREERVPYSGTMDSLYSIITHLGYYYGSEKYACDLFDIYETELVLNLDAFEGLERNKVIVDARIDEMLSMLKEGSDRFKLFQIASYITERIVYTDGVVETVDGLNGNGVCATYSMLFYKAATRLGIQTYICYGQIGEAYHAWNMVVLDGERYFYDVTWFDTELYDFQYLHNTDSWRRNFILNNIWGHLYLTK
jgi:hypothetical protein